MSQDALEVMGDTEWVIHLALADLTDVTLVKDDTYWKLRPRDTSRASGNLLVVGDVQPNTSLLSAVYVYIIVIIMKLL